MAILSYEKGRDIRLSPNFSTHEFQCPCTNDSCKRQLIDTDLIMRLEKVRAELDSPLIILSGYRCAAHQQDIRDQGYQTAHGTSQHELGEAVDLFAPKASHEETEEVLKQYFKSLGVARTWFHVDMRSDKIRSWTYP